MIKFLQRILIMCGLGGCILSVHFESPKSAVPTTPQANNVSEPSPPSYAIRWEIPQTEQTTSLPQLMTTQSEPVIASSPSPQRRFRPFAKLRKWLTHQR